jgi:hypothetical protein
MSDLPNDTQLLEEAEPRRLVLPPPYSPRRIEAGDVLAEALRLAPEEGAGTLVWRHGGGVLAFAVVLEPEQSLAQARMAFFAGMCALGDALAAHCAPDRPVRFGWPDTIVYDAARLGGARFAAPEDCAAADVPGLDGLCRGVDRRARPSRRSGRIPRLDLAQGGGVRTGRGHPGKLCVLPDAVVRPLGTPGAAGCGRTLSGTPRSAAGRRARARSPTAIWWNARLRAKCARSRWPTGSPPAAGATPGDPNCDTAAAHHPARRL